MFKISKLILRVTRNNECLSFIAKRNFAYELREIMNVSLLLRSEASHTSFSEHFYTQALFFSGRFHFFNFSNTRDRERNETT